LGTVKRSNKPGRPLPIRMQGLTSKSERVPEGPQVLNESHKSNLDAVAPMAPALTGVEASVGDAVAEASPPATALVSDVPADGAQSNGDEIDPRMTEIKKILGHAAMYLLDKCGLVAEWLHHAEAKLSILRQDVQKSAGRPEGALTRAARELPVPGSTPKARRKFIERALKIDGVWPEAKSAARDAGLDDIQSALLAVARERSLEAQLARVQEIAARKAMPRLKSTGRKRGEGTVVASAKLPSTVSDGTRGKHDDLAPASKDAPTPEAVATGAELRGPSAPPPGDDDIPPFLDRRPLSAENQRIFDAIMASLRSAPAIVRERVRAELMRENTSRSAADPIDRSRGNDDAGAIPGAMPNQPTASVVSAQASRTRRVPGPFEEPPF
jgi:hypothetical protein